MSNEHDESEGEPGEEASGALVDWLAEHLADSLTSVAGYDARVDAGEKGQIWIALKGAVDDSDAEHGLLQAFEHRLDRLRDDVPNRFEVEVSTGQMGDDIILRCRVLKPTSGPE